MNTITDHINIWITAQTQKSMGRNRGIDNIHQHGVKRLRELILELAVRGKLVPQDPNDEPASVLLKRIAEEKKQLIKEGKIKKQEVLPEVRTEEEPFELPDGWAFEYLGKFIYLEMGQSPASNFYNQDNIGIPFFQGKADFGDLFPTPRYWCTQPIKYSYPDDILLSVRAPVGPTNISIIECCIGRGLAALRPLSSTDKKYILYFMRASQGKLESLATGTTFSAVSKTDIETFVIAIPPLAEQQRIVTKVDELMALCDKLEQQQTGSIETHQLLVETLLKTLTDAKDAAELKEAWQQIENNFGLLFTTEESVDLLKQTILQLAVMGKLTQDFRTQNPELVSGANSARELLKKIAAEKEKLIAEGKIKKQNPLPEITDDERPFELPVGWEMVRLKELGYFCGGGTPSKSKLNYWNGDILWVSPKDMYSNFIDDSELKITLEGVNNSTAKLIPEGSILIVARSGILKRKLPVSINAIKCTVNQDLKVLVLFKKELNFYVQLLLKGFEGFILRELVKQGMTVQSLEYEKFEIQAFPLPPFAEQLNIIAKVDELFALCDALKERIDESQEIKVKLADAVVEVAVKEKPAGKVIYRVNEQLSLAAEPE